MRGRFAPSPTGWLHLGNVRSALLGWLAVRAQGGQFLLRIEDLDGARCRPEYTQGIIDDLRFLGLDWDGEVLHQSRRKAVYDAAVARLLDDGAAYPCACSRADVLRAAGAPHVGEEGPRYPGTCATPGVVLPPGKPTSVRFRAKAGPTSFVDELLGPQGHDVAAEVGDFVIRRADGVASYQLAVVVDDAAQGITQVVRGEDLTTSTPRQLQLFDALGWAAPSFAHVPLLLGTDGHRLAKRQGSLTVASLRARGATGPELVGLLAGWSGLSQGAPCTPAELVSGFTWASVRREPTVVDAAELDRRWP